MTSLIIDKNGVIPTGGGPVPLVGIPAALLLYTNGWAVDAAQVIPLNPISNQQLDIVLNNQAVTLTIYTKHIMVPFVPSGGIPTDPPVYQSIDPIFLDLYLNGALLLGGVLCLDRNLIVRNAYLGFVGDLSFLDVQGTNDPETTGLGSRYQLCYFPNIIGQ